MSAYAVIVTFNILKNMLLSGFRAREQARRIIFEYIEVFYNRIRCHAKINNQSPADFAIQYAISSKIAAVL